MLNIISILLTFVFNAAKYLLGFLVIVFLGILGAVLYALPWLLRMAALILWLGGDYLGFITIQTIYAPFSPAVPVIVLQLAVILISVGGVLIILDKNASFVWGGMATGGVFIGSTSIVSLWLLTHWLYADLFFRVLPPALFSVLLIHETIRLRSIRHSRNSILEA